MLSSEHISLSKVEQFTKLCKRNNKIKAKKV